MKIGVDARMYGLKHAGIGRYVECLIKGLLLGNDSNDYVLLVRSAEYGSIKKQVLSIKSIKAPKIIIAEARHYTVKEQLLIPYILEKEKLDLVHFPHFNVPLLYQGRFVVTIHDLLWHETKGREVTTLPSYLYDIKYAGYRLVFANAVKRAQKVFVPSKWVKNKLISTYNIDSNKVIVTYEGIDDNYKKYQVSRSKYQGILGKYRLTKPFFIYTGSAYPHKNLKRLLEVTRILNYSSSAARSFQNSSRPFASNNNVQLAIACARDVFWEKLEREVKEKDLQNQVKLLGFVPDEDLKVLYQEALAFVFPSLSEGFGLPGLEAMACGCPVLAANAGSLPEIYGNAVLYFNPLDTNDMAEKLQLVIGNDKLRKDLVSKGLKQAKKYSWEKMAQETLSAYELCLKEKNK
ncbi:glycosyltransferase family 4 protein [Candidatus Gottesmanbacteria bacterium]|nr:glycosyltransferase family 4 protein [Candidatus Gottesmanbacteria bacterium]